MKISESKVVLLAPVYSPYPAGGAQSFPIVATSLSKLFKSVLVLTEYHPCRPLFCNESGVSVMRILPVRDNKGSKNHFYSLAAYFVTQILLLFILPVLRLFGFSAFHYTRYSSLALYFLLSIWKVSGGIVVYDCRTMALGDRSLKTLRLSLASANAALANSESALDSISNLASLPVFAAIVNPLVLPSKGSIPPLSSFDSLSCLSNVPYILVLGTLSGRKNSISILDAFNHLLSHDTLLNSCSESHLSPKYARLKLVYAGRSDLPKADLERLRYSESVLYLGSVSHIESIALSSAASLSVNISNAEGIPRSMLEALYLQTPCILPGCVPEFLRYVPELCFPSGQPSSLFVSALASLISCVLSNPSRARILASRYPIDSHFVDDYHDRLFQAVYQYFYDL